MRIIQLTDFHVGKPGEDTGGVDVRQNFIDSLAKAQEYDPDFVALTGDFCLQTAEESVYEWMKEKLDGTGLSYFPIPGNHDDPVMLASHLGRKHLLKGKEVYYAYSECQQAEVLFMDSSSGTVSDTQIAWLREQVRESERQLLLFIHHPVLAVHMPFMEQRYFLQNRQVIEGILASHPQPVYIFCGHYHSNRSSHKGKLHQFISPSGYFQIHPFNENFQIDHYRAGLRLIDLHEDHIETMVVEW